MKTLLVPTDFSDNATAACQYAAMLASRYEWKLRLLHAYNPFYTVFQPSGQNQEERDLLEKQVSESMSAVIADLRNRYPTVAIAGEKRLGNVADAVVHSVAEINGVKMVVMGTKGATGLRYALLGSNTFDVIKKSPVAVLAVPEKLNSHRLDKVGFPINFHATEIAALFDFVDLMDHPMEITLFHLYERGKKDAEVRMQEWRRKFERMIADSWSVAHFQVARTANIQTGINRFTLREKLDALVMTAMDKPFLERAFSGKKMVKAVAHRLVVPVFFMKGIS